MTTGAGEVDESRAEPRATITLRVDYKRLNTFFADYTKNISRGGTFIRTDRPLSVGTEFTFVLALPEAGEIGLRGVVRWVVTSEAATAEKPAGMGIQFVFANDEQRREVDELVARLMSQAFGPALAKKLLGGR